MKKQTKAGKQLALAIQMGFVERNEVVVKDNKTEVKKHLDISNLGISNGKDFGEYIKNVRNNKP